MTLKLVEHIMIRGTAEMTFDYTQDYGNRLQWDTFLKRADLLGPRPGVGVRAWCVSKQGLGMETEYVTYNRPKVTAVKMTKPTLLFQSFAGSWKFEETVTGETKVTFTYNYTLKFPLNLGGFLINAVFSRNVRQRLKDLKSNIERLPINIVSNPNK